jgi:hypothetical protein
MVVGSTCEETRLRLCENEGDYDYLIISEIVIPSECLEYKDDIPAFVNIHGTSLKEFHGWHFGRFLFTSSGHFITCKQYSNLNKSIVCTMF